ncbi:MAG: SDR family oxidoreductase [Ruminococcus sp.]|nr:SDR family oxidoreductase [Ruminococcus sp.]
MDKWVLITGASSGIGEELAKLYAKRGYSVALAARRADRLYALAMKLETDTRVVPCDLADRQSCFDLFDAVDDLNVEMLINCAGFGAVGRFDSIDLERQIEMTDVNCTALMILTHLFLKDFKYRDRGTILNVASSAGLLPGGPNMAVYYATKAYVVSLTNAIFEELKLAGSHVKIAALCPGPVDTEFNQVANVRFALKGITPQYCAKCAAWGLDRGKRIIIPEEIMKLTHIASKLSPERVSLLITAHQQKRKM